MPQRRLETYFTLPPSAPVRYSKSILDLPYDVRRRIYILAGLVRFCPINLNQEGLRKSNLALQAEDSSCFYYARRFLGKWYGWDHVVSCRCDPLPVSLLFVSHAVNEEVLSILYSENAFTIGRSDHWGLKPVRNLSKRALACLRSLTIRLSNCSCLYRYGWTGGLQVPSCTTLCEGHGLHDKAIGGSARQDRAVLQEWADLVLLMACSISPAQLSLSLVCDTKARDAAQQATTPLHQLPLLRKCAIRLGNSPDPELQHIARRTVAKLTNLPAPNNPKAYNYYLPEEILEHILTYTDIKAPFDLEWYSNGKGLVPFDCCKTCTDTLDCCSCSFYHAAYSSRCTCWRLPIDIFLVSHTVNWIATKLFYSSNRFVLPRRDPYCPDNRSFPRTLPWSALTGFLSMLPDKAFPFLRHVSVVISGENLFFPLESHGHHIEWENSIKLLARKADPAKLTFTLEVEECSDWSWWTPDVFRQQFAHKRLVHAVSFLVGLQNFFVHLKSEHRSTYSESVIERSVMGPNYDAIANGKANETRKRWFNNYSEEDPVFGPDGQKIWPLP